MPKTTLTVLAAGLGNLALLTEASADQANGNDFVNDGNTVFIVSNEDTSTSTTVSIAANNDKYGRAVTKSVAVPIGRVAIIGPLDPDVFNDSNGKVGVTYTSGTNIKVFPVALTPWR